ncbi:MAG: YkvA family protein [Candidatus Binatia bacterium]
MTKRQGRRSIAKSEIDLHPLPQHYIDEAARSGGEAKVHEGFARKLTRIAKDNPVVNLAREAYGYMTDPRVPTRYKIMVIGALLYFLAPIDTVPDGIPGLGYVDDMLVLSAIVASVHRIIQTAREDAKEVIHEAEAAAERVVQHTLSEARETWGRRGVAQFAVCLWGATTAAAVGLIYYGTRRLIFDSGTVDATDPFFWAALIAASLGFIYNLFFLGRIWKRYSDLSPDIREPLAYALVSLMDWHQVLILSCPVLAFLVLIILRISLS